MPADEERLMVLVEARITELEKGMKKAQGVANAAYAGMKRASRSATADMEADMVRSTGRINQLLASTSSKIGSYGKAFAGGLVGGFVAAGITGIVSQIGEIAHGVAEVGDQAKRAGLSIQAFQELKFVAEQNRIGVDSLTDGMKELQLRADEFIATGGGAGAEAFQRLGYGAEDLKKKLADPNALLLEMIGRLEKFDKAAQIRIADEVFGGSGGERFVELLDQGEAGIRETIDRAHELGAVMSDDVIEKAAELDRRFNEISNTVGSTLKSAIVSAADSLSQFIDGFRDFENQQNRTLASKAQDVDRQRLDLENQILDLRRQQSEETGIYAEHEKRMLEGSISALEDQRKALTDEGARIEGIIAGRQTAAMKQQSNTTWTPPKAPAGGFGSKSGGSKKRKASGASEAEREAEALRKLIAELEEEISLVGQSDQAKRAAEASRRAGAKATDEERAKVIALTEALYQEEQAQKARAEAAQKALEDMEKQQQAIGDAGEFGFGLVEDALTAVIDKTMTAEEALKKMLIQLAMAAAQGALLGQGPLAGLFGGGGGGLLGGLFGGGGGMGLSALAASSIAGGGIGLFADGGISHKPAIFGESGPEAAVPLPDGRRIPVDLRGAGGGRTGVDVRVSVDQNGNLHAFVERVSTGVAQKEASSTLNQYRGSDAMMKDVSGSYREARSNRHIR